MSDEPIAVCQECRSPVERVFHPVAVHFKGSGFYTTDYGRKRTHAGDSGGNGAKSDSDTSTAKPEGSSDSKSGSSSESTPESKSSSSDD